VAIKLKSAKLKSARKPKINQCLSTGNVFALTIFSQLFVGFYTMDFRNLSGHQSTKPHHYVKVADHCGAASPVDTENVLQWTVPHMDDINFRVCCLFP